jgi:hypothetical protein
MCPPEMNPFEVESAINASLFFMKMMVTLTEGTGSDCFIHNLNCGKENNRLALGLVAVASRVSADLVRVQEHLLKKDVTIYETGRN